MERNYEEDQKSEVEALESIYSEEIEIIEENPYKFSIIVSSTDFDHETANGICCHFTFILPSKYPDERPQFEIENPTNFQDGYEKDLAERLKNTIDENVGMEMIFSLVSCAQEWMNDKWEEHKKEEEEERVKLLIESEEAERKIFEGTKVNLENFLKWRMSFELEMGIAERREQLLGEARKLTGKELFLRDTTLNDSDLKFLLEAGDSVENVKIDESLFQNLDDLELDSDFEDNIESIVT